MYEAHLTICRLTECEMNDSGHLYEHNTPTADLKQYAVDVHETFSLPDCVRNLCENLGTALTMAQGHMEDAQHRHKEQYDQHISDPVYPVGCRVWLHRPKHVITVGGTALKILGTQNGEIQIGSVRLRHATLVIDNVKETIIGADLLRRLKVSVDLERNELRVDGDVVRLHRDETKDQCRVGRVSMMSLPHCPISAIRQYVSEFADLFTNADDQYGFCRWMEHTIDLQPGEECRPVYRRIPFKLIPEVEKQLKEMLEKGIIQETSSPFSSLVVLTRKSDRTYRFCVDFRELNPVTIKDAFRMPQMEEIFAHLHEARVLSPTDLRSGYWQLPTARKDRVKIAFCVNGQQYEFLRMPFGLCNAPATFRRLLLRILEDQEGVTVYGDDIVVFSQTVSEHVDRLRAVLRRIDAAGLKLSSKKCQIGRRSIVCLGHTKSTAIKNFPAPKSKQQLRCFLGMVGYDPKFMPGFSQKAYPLFQLLRKDRKFVRTKHLEVAFNELKQEAASIRRCLTISKPSEPFTVSVDASDIGIGAVLSQPSGTIKMSAIVWTLEKWRTYLITTTVHVEIDHKPLIWLKTAKDPRGRLARWALRLQELNFTIGHVNGTNNELPDALS
ncbi:uncharacterized protein DEA37_0006871 [Paragonimus westermani]|uniref:RNA-directed DNA polymerase n=1 Tax=Paragonimus westermani TaxID=34504 RepID=A0A5J4NI32_9TREM|nr:uncharacterized protein DEA37_0006871 [Paragonimus westermani]